MKKKNLEQVFNPETIESGVAMKYGVVWPRYEVARDGRESRIFRPVKILTLPNGGLIALCRAFTNEDSWLIFSSEGGKTWRTAVSDQAGEHAWEYLCDQLTGPTKENLIAKLEGDEFSREQRDAAIDELFRLALGDDDLYDGGLVPPSPQFRAEIAEELASRAAAGK